MGIFDKIVANRKREQGEQEDMEWDLGPRVATYRAPYTTYENLEKKYNELRQQYGEDYEIMPYVEDGTMIIEVYKKVYPTRGFSPRIREKASILKEKASVLKEKLASLRISEMSQHIGQEDNTGELKKRLEHTYSERTSDREGGGMKELTAEKRQEGEVALTRKGKSYPKESSRKDSLGVGGKRESPIEILGKAGSVAFGKPPKKRGRGRPGSSKTKVEEYQNLDYQTAKMIAQYWRSKGYYVKMRLDAKGRWDVYVYDYSRKSSGVDVLLSKSSGNMTKSLFSTKPLQTTVNKSKTIDTLFNSKALGKTGLEGTGSISSLLRDGAKEGLGGLDTLLNSKTGLEVGLNDKSIKKLLNWKL